MLISRKNRESRVAVGLGAIRPHTWHTVTPPSLIIVIAFESFEAWPSSTDAAERGSGIAKAPVRWGRGAQQHGAVATEVKGTEWPTPGERV
jgi:hypothetical protein